MKEIKLEVEVEELEERMAPIVHAFLGGILSTGMAASDGAAGGVAAVGAGAIRGVSGIGVPVPCSTPGVGPC